MPFCSSCGKPVANTDVFCAVCGSRQPVAPPPPPGQSFAERISPNTAALLCYIPMLGWIASIVVLASNRFREERNVRFHAFQGLYLFVAWLLLDQVMRPMFGLMGRHPFHVGGLLELALFAASIFMMIKVRHQENYSLPIIGDLAQKSTES